jgi:hypothetical protein
MMQKITPQNQKKMQTHPTASKEDMQKSQSCSTPSLEDCKQKSFSTIKRRCKNHYV